MVGMSEREKESQNIMRGEKQALRGIVESSGTEREEAGTASK